MNTAKKIDMAIEKVADDSSQLSDTIAELTIEIAALVQEEYGISPLSAFKGAGDAIAAVVAAAPRICADIAKDAGGVTKVDSVVMSRASIDKFLRQQQVIDAITRAVLRKARAYSEG